MASDDTDKKFRKIPLIGRVATEDAFRALEASTEEFMEAQDKLVRRAVEDMGWQDVSDTPDVGLSDMSPARRKQVVRRAVKYWLEDPQVGNGVDLYTNYIFGRGLDAPRFQFTKAQRVIDKFWSDADNKRTITSFEAQQQKSTELQLQGDIYFTMFSASGEVKISNIVYSEIDEIITHPEDVKVQVFYRRRIKPTLYNFESHRYESDASADIKTLYHADWVNYPLADDDEYADKMEPAKIEEGVVYHVSINRLSDGKMGNPRVLRILDWAYSYNQFMRARVALMEAAAWLAWRRKMNGDPTQIRKVAANFVQQRFDGHGAGVENDGTSPAPPPARYAAMITENQNSSMEFVKTDTGSANAKNDGGMLQSQVASGIGFPKHYFGDSAGSNLATATAMELPVLKMCEAGQETWEGIFKAMVDFALRKAIENGDLPRPVYGKFSDADGEKIAEGTSARKHGFSDEFIESMGEKYGSEAFIEADRDVEDDFDVDISKISGDDLYAYDLELPPILQRQLAETINSVVNMVKAFDPNGNNDELLRWAYDYCLKTFNVSNAAQVMERVMPKGKTYDRGPVKTQQTGDATDVKHQRPDAKDETGGPTRAWTPEDHAAASKEAEVDSSLLEQLKLEFDQEVRSIHETLTDEMLTAASLKGDSDAD